MKYQELRDAPQEKPKGAPSEEVVSKEELQKAFTNTNFGTDDHRQLLEVSVLKKAVGYHCGHTITVIMGELGLIQKSGLPTKKGQRLLQCAFNDLMRRKGG
ncbi:hypothetical protein E8K88_11810 [Lampropedia aestuarii]|uniref:Uncharacterized protein n=1 Tax=Lampropedia aestuarii TaxID=2562762 RepID=A0A4V6S773_9BURK|nr:hypothetical protein [Lampropedia aestuarii]THJ32382.1 hypothetical protein E8K88_11810 [Lampropedia aestuarii]